MVTSLSVPAYVSVVRHTNRANAELPNVRRMTGCRGLWRPSFRVTVEQPRRRLIAHCCPNYLVARMCV